MFTALHWLHGLITKNAHFILLRTSQSGVWMKQALQKVCMALHLATFCCVHLDSIGMNCKAFALIAIWATLGCMLTELVRVCWLLAEDQRRSVAAAHAKPAHFSSGDNERTPAVTLHCWAHLAT